MRMMRLWQDDLDKEKDAFEKERTQWEEDCAAFEVRPAIPTLRYEPASSAVWALVLSHR